MELVFAGEAAFAGLWQQLAATSGPVPWRYLPTFLDYQRLYCEKWLKQDLSFVVADPAPVAICPLFLEQAGAQTQFSYAGSYQNAPFIRPGLNEKYRKKVERFCYDTVDRLAAEHGAAKNLLLIDPQVGRPVYNVLTEYGYLEASISTILVDLSLSETELRANLRASYKSLVNQTARDYTLDIMDYRQPDFQRHEQYRQLHHKAAGRVTRPLRTFELQFELLKQDHAVLVFLLDHDRPLAFSYFFHHSQGAYFASASDDPDYPTAIPLEHGITWAAIAYYQRRGFKQVELGWQQFGPQVWEHPTPNDLGISFFKRGFGGQLVSLYRGIKYYDKQLLKRELDENAQKLISEV